MSLHKHKVTPFVMSLLTGLSFGPYLRAATWSPDSFEQTLVPGVWWYDYLSGADDSQIKTFDGKPSTATMLLLEYHQNSTLSTKLANLHSCWSTLHLCETAWAAKWQANQTGNNVAVYASDLEALYNFAGNPNLRELLQEKLPLTDVVSSSQFPPISMWVNGVIDATVFNKTIVMQSAGNNGASDDPGNNFVPTELAPLVVKTGAASFCAVDEYSSEGATLVANNPFEQGLLYDAGMPPDNVVAKLAQPEIRSAIIASYFDSVEGLKRTDAVKDNQPHISYNGVDYILVDLERFSYAMILPMNEKYLNSVESWSDKKVRKAHDKFEKLRKEAIVGTKFSQPRLDELGPSLAEYFNAVLDVAGKTYRDSYQADTNTNHTHMGGTSYSTPAAGGMIASAIGQHRELGPYGNFAAAILASIPLDRRVAGKQINGDYYPFNAAGLSFYGTDVGYSSRIGLDYRYNAAGLPFNDTYAGFGLLDNARLQATADELSKLASRAPSKIIPVREDIKGAVSRDGLHVTFHARQPSTMYRVLFSFIEDHGRNGPDSDFENFLDMHLVDIQSPSGTRFQNYTEDFTYTPKREWHAARFVTTAAFFGEQGAGDWMVTVPKKLGKIDATMTLIGIEPGNYVDDALHGGIDLSKLPQPDCPIGSLHPLPPRTALKGIAAILSR